MVRTVDSRDAVTVGDGQTSGSHGFEFAVCRGEAHPGSAGECADTPPGLVGPQPPKKLPPRAARHQVVEHGVSLSY